MVGSLKNKLKPIVRKTLIIINLLIEWVTAPIYAAAKNYHVYRTGFNQLISVPHKGVFSAAKETENTFTHITNILTKASVEFDVISHVDGRLAIIVMAAV